MKQSIAAYFSKGEWLLWGGSVCGILLAFLAFDRESWMTLAASLIGVTSLIFNAKGNPAGQALIILFSLLYGAKTPADLSFQSDMPEWLERKDLNVTLTIDNPADGWEHKVGLIPNVLKEIGPKPKNTIAVLCGPPIMIKFTLAALVELGFPDDQIYTTLEKRMKCGIGICGRCNIGGKLVCVDGPVFSNKQLKELPPEL